MRHRALILGAVCCVAVASVASADKKGKKPESRDSTKADVSKCVEVRTEAIYVPYGYDHHVHVHNGCDKRVRCEVTASSNPATTVVTLASGETQDVVMFRGSPASEVSATVKCEAQDSGKE